MLKLFSHLSPPKFVIVFMQSNYSQIDHDCSQCEAAMSILAKQFLLAAMLIYLVFKNSSIKEHFSSLHNPEKLNSAPLLKGDAVAVNKRKEPQTCYLRDQNSNIDTKLNCSLADFKSLGNPRSSLPSISLYVH